METPIYSALKQYAGLDILRLHMPGHAGIGFNQQEFKALAALDLTEIRGMDDLHLPTGIIKESQQLMAEIFGSAKSFFLVNGATSGIHALLLALAAEGSKILLPRNAHRSFYGGMVLSGAMPVYIPVQRDPYLDIALAVTAQDVEKLLHSNPDIAAVFLCSPSYYGTTCDISTISRITHDHHKRLLIDEAHGAHFYFSNLFPRSALRAGADGVVNGLHKTMPVFTQGAALNLAPDLADDLRIDRAVSLLTTTSPSYPIMASIELACQFMKEKGEKLLNKAYQLSSAYRLKINSIPGLKVWEEELQDVAGVVELDPLKVLVSVKGTALTGYQFAAILRENYRIQVELADNNLILAMFTLFHEANAWEIFYQALKSIAASYPGSGEKSSKISLIPPLPKVVLSPRQAFKGRCRRVALTEAANQVAGEMIAPYPPGIPCLLPGELISQEMVDYLSYLAQSGASVQGPEDHSLQFINVIADSG